MTTAVLSLSYLYHTFSFNITVSYWITFGTDNYHFWFLFIWRNFLELLQVINSTPKLKTQKLPEWGLLYGPDVISVKPNTHRWRRRDSTVELSHVGGVNAVCTRRQSDPVYNFLCCWAIDVTVEKVINIDQNSHSQAAMKSHHQFPNCRRNPTVWNPSSWASFEFMYTPPTPTRPNSTAESRRIGGVYWLLPSQQH